MKWLVRLHVYSCDTKIGFIVALFFEAAYASDAIGDGNKGSH